MMKRNDIQRDEIAVSRDVGDLDAREKIEEVKREVSRMQSSRQKKSEVLKS